MLSLAFLECSLPFLAIFALRYLRSWTPANWWSDADAWVEAELEATEEDVQWTQ